MITSLNLLKSGNAPFLLQTEGKVDLGALGAASAFVDEALSIAEDTGPSTVRTHKTEPVVKTIRINGGNEGIVYCAFAGNDNLEKLRLTCRFLEKDGKPGRVLVVYMPFPNTGRMTVENLDQSVVSVLRYAAWALRILSEIDLAANSETVDRIMTACATFASTLLPSSPLAYATTINLPTPLEPGKANYDITDEEVEVLQKIGPGLTLSTLIHDENTGSVTIILQALEKLSSSVGPHSASERMHAYALLCRETAVGDSSHPNEGIIP